MLLSTTSIWLFASLNIFRKDGWSFLLSSHYFVLYIRICLWLLRDIVCLVLSWIGIYRYITSILEVDPSFALELPNIVTKHSS